MMGTILSVLNSELLINVMQDMDFTEVSFYDITVKKH